MLKPCYKAEVFNKKFGREIKSLYLCTRFREVSPGGPLESGREAKEC